MEQQYTILAKYYDILMGDFDYKGYVAFVEKYLKGNGVDLCCGSGKIAIYLAKNGRNIIGVDASIDMLNEAMANSKKEGLKIQWLCNNVTEFEPMKKLDFASCVCDGFNYLNPSDLKKTFDKVAQYIKKDGYFVFDISTLYKLKDIVGNNVFCDDEDKISYIWGNHFDTKRNAVNMQIAFFEMINGNNYKRYDEQHLQFGHTIDEIMTLLVDNWDVQIYDGEGYSYLEKTSKRALFVCKRN